MRKLLEENTVKRFMKLANIEPLTESFAARLQEEEDEEGDMPPMGDMGDEAGEEAGEEPMDDMGDDDMGDDDMDMDAEGEDAKVDMPEDQVLDLVDAIASAVEDVTGVAVDAVSADESGDDEGDDMEDEGDMDAAGEDAPEGDDEVLDEMGMKSYKRDYKRDPMMEMDAEDEKMAKMEEALLNKLRRLREHKARKQALRLGGGHHRARALNEARLDRIAERVMKRIREEAKAADDKDQLAERVMNRVIKRLNEASRAQKARKTKK